MQRDDTIRDQAALWAVRTHDAQFESWPEFVGWLESDRAHSAAYDAAVLKTAEAVETLRRGNGAQIIALSALPAANDAHDNVHAAPRRWAMPALAAACAGLAALGAWQFGAPDTVYTTAPGETRMIALDDGSRIELAGGSRLALDAHDSRRATLETGRALFHVRHDAANPFTLAAGGAELVDAGTTFDVSIGKSRMDVEVAEGAVIVNPSSVKIRLDEGQRVTRSEGTWQVERVDPAAVGEWRSGRIAFREASLDDIADQLSSASGVRFVAAPNTPALALSGSVMLESVRTDPASLGPLLGVTVRPQGDDWVISSP